jgi:hypothetical protein
VGQKTQILQKLHLVDSIITGHPGSYEACTLIFLGVEVGWAFEGLCQELLLSLLMCGKPIHNTACSNTWFNPVNN